MPEDPYPLKTAREVRERATDEAEAALAAALRAHARAETVARGAETALTEFRRAERARIRQEEQRLRSCRASELLRSEAFAARQRAREAVLAHKLAEAHRGMRLAALDVKRARKLLERRSVEHKLLERHQDRWRAQRKRAAERRRDDDIDELAAQKKRL